MCYSYISFGKNMARRGCLTAVLVLCFAASLPLSESSLRKVEFQTHKPTGVFLVLDGEKYTLNFTAARATCLFLNVTIATRAQIEHAVQQGLETCKFGWIAEQMAVIPRLQSNKNCGKGKTGVVTWQTSADKKFGVFCFNASDQDAVMKTSTAIPQSSTASMSLTALTWTSSPLRPLVRSTFLTSTKRPIETQPTTKETSSTSDLQTRSTRISSSTYLVPETLTTQRPVSTHHLITSKLTVITLAFLTSPQATTSSVSSEPQSPQTVSSAKPSPGAGPAALISLGVVILLLTAAGVVWSCKSKRNALFRYQRQQKDVTETEMWRNIHSDTDLHCEPEVETDYDEELDMKDSRDVTLCVNPYFKANSSQ